MRTCAHTLPLPHFCLSLFQFSSVQSYSFSSSIGARTLKMTKDDKWQMSLRCPSRSSFFFFEGIHTNTSCVCVLSGGGPTEQGSACIYMCNMIHTQIGGQEENGQIEPVQRVRWRARMTMMLSLTFRAHHVEVFTHVVVWFVLDAYLQDTRHSREWVMAHIWMSHDTHMNESWHTYEWVMAHICMSHGTHIHESWHTYEWVMANIWLSHGTHMKESWHT
jgi:hypothetical protein